MTPINMYCKLQYKISPIFSPYPKGKFDNFSLFPYGKFQTWCPILFPSVNVQVFLMAAFSPHLFGLSDTYFFPCCNSIILYNIGETLIMYFFKTLDFANVKKKIEELLLSYVYAKRFSPSSTFVRFFLVVQACTSVIFN